MNILNIKKHKNESRINKGFTTFAILFLSLPILIIGTVFMVDNLTKPETEPLPWEDVKIPLPENLPPEIEDLEEEEGDEVKSDEYGNFDNEDQGDEDINSDDPIVASRDLSTKILFSDDDILEIKDGKVTLSVEYDYLPRGFEYNIEPIEVRITNQVSLDKSGVEDWSKFLKNEPVTNFIATGVAVTGISSDLGSRKDYSGYNKIPWTFEIPIPTLVESKEANYGISLDDVDGILGSNIDYKVESKIYLEVISTVKDANDRSITSSDRQIFLLEPKAI